MPAAGKASIPEGVEMLPAGCNTPPGPGGVVPALTWPTWMLVGPQAAIAVVSIALTQIPILLIVCSLSCQCARGTTEHILPQA